jgi:hypothetical protein
MTDTVHEAIEATERLLPGVAAPDGELDPRWQAIIEVEGFIETDPEEIWHFIRRWGCDESEDLRRAIATCPLEDLVRADPCSPTPSAGAGSSVRPWSPATRSASIASRTDNKR